MKSFDFKDKKVLIRVDFNVPQDENLAVTDNTRIMAAAPTIKKVLAEGGIPVLMSHLGRPGGERVPKMSLSALVDEVEKLLGPQFILQKTVSAMSPPPQLLKQRQEKRFYWRTYVLQRRDDWR